MGEQHQVGLDDLTAVTAQLQRVRGAHPTAGLYEAADLQWWWRKPRPTDDLPQLFWFDQCHGAQGIGTGIAVSRSGETCQIT